MHTPSRTRSTAALCCCLSLLAIGGAAGAQDVNALPAHLSVQPVFLIPFGSTIPDPSPDDITRLSQQLYWVQVRYWQMLGYRDTFQIAGAPVKVKDPDKTHTASFYSTDSGGTFALTVMNYMGTTVDQTSTPLHQGGTPYNRYNNPYVYLIIAWGIPATKLAGTYGSPLNSRSGGGGISVIKSPTFWNPSSGPDKLQSTMEHELGHAFGLPHSWQSGYADPNNNNQYNWCYGTSIMSYNPLHWTDGFTPASQLSISRPAQTSSFNPPTCPAISGVGVDAILLPEEIKLLSLNKRVFPYLYFDPEVDIPLPYNFQPLGISGAFNELAINGAATPFPNADLGPSESVYAYTYDSTLGGSVQNLYAWIIRKDDPNTAFDANSMWISEGNGNGWASSYIYFTNPVTLSALGVHTEFGGAFFAADQVCVTDVDNGAPLFCSSIGVDDIVQFPAPVTAATWYISLHSKSGSYVATRGLQFLTPQGEILPHKEPEEALTLPQVTTSSAVIAGATNECYGSRVNHVLGPAITPDVAASSGGGYDATTMWHSCATNSLGWTSLQVTFPYPLTLYQVDIKSQHSGLYHAANQIQVEYLNDQNQLTYLNRKTVGVEDSITFATTKARTWQIDFHSLDGYVTVRALRFHTPLPSVTLSGYPDNPDSILFP